MTSGWLLHRLLTLWPTLYRMHFSSCRRRSMRTLLCSARSSPRSSSSPASTCCNLVFFVFKRSRSHVLFFAKAWPMKCFQCKAQRYLFHFRDYLEFINAGFNSDSQNDLSILLKIKNHGRFSIHLHDVRLNADITIKCYTITSNIRLRGYHDSTFGGFIYNLLKEINIWCTLKVILENGDVYGILPRILWPQKKYEGSYLNLLKDKENWDTILGLKPSVSFVRLFCLYRNKRSKCL